MSHISRRSLLGTSGAAAAGAVLTSAGTAQADDGASASAAEFPPDTEFSGFSSIGDIDTRLALSFSIQTDGPLGEHAITAAEVANALSELAVSRGWPPITFYGRPAPAPVN